MSSALITTSFVVPAGYAEGDYALLHGNAGSGDVDWDKPLSSEQLSLFPNGAGIYGFGRAPFGRHRFGRGHSMNCQGFGHIPFGKGPFGHGTGIVEAEYEADQCGDYLFGLACYDSLGNAHEGTPEETEVEVHVAPDAPTGLVKNSYDKDTDVLVLDAA